MKILLVNAYLRNTGDAALSSVLIGQLRQAWPGAEITVSSVEEAKAWPVFEGCPNIGSMRLYAGLVQGNKLHRVARKLLLLIVETFWSRLPARLRMSIIRFLPAMVREELRALAGADVVISTAGGYLNGSGSLAGDLSVRYMLLPLKLAEQLGKPVLLAPQSYGAFGNNRQLKALQSVLSRACCIMTRESKSYDLLHSLGIDERLLVRAVDAAFAFEPHLNGRHTSHKTPMTVAVTTRSWSSPVKQRAYEQALAELIVHLHRQHRARVVIISHVMKDVYSNDGSAVDRRIAALAGQLGASKVEVVDTTNHHVMKQLYGSLDYIVGTRFHSVIFSLTDGVPAMAIEYQHKTSGIMRDLGLEEWVINFEDVTPERLIALFERLVKHRAAYLRHLRSVLPAYIEQAQSTAAILKQAYNQWSDKDESAGTG